MTTINLRYTGRVEVHYNQLTAARDGKSVTVVLTDAEMRALVMDLLLRLFNVSGGS